MELMLGRTGQLYQVTILPEQLQLYPGSNDILFEQSIELGLECAYSMPDSPVLHTFPEQSEEFVFVEDEARRPDGP